MKNIFMQMQRHYVSTPRDCSFFILYDRFYENIETFLNLYKHFLWIKREYWLENIYLVPSSISLLSSKQEQLLKMINSK